MLTLDAIERIEIALKSEIDCGLSADFGSDWYDNGKFEFDKKLSV